MENLIKVPPEAGATSYQLPGDFIVYPLSISFWNDAIYNSSRAYPK
jgi:hypothetical protein